MLSMYEVISIEKVCKNKTLNIAVLAKVYLL